ncbi:hypothetical protein CesoFtcFv8_012026 [Champsocephalus esox]|uniref:Uncharacterized protein n=1 Tax=Champsocephalus esox TaxID=159716 RepID=A0AAN8GYB8_9TELE|nr:hypothetical protein CesoFtcFv8_012026 [Champsocephalus esox]
MKLECFNDSLRSPPVSRRPLTEPGGFRSGASRLLLGPGASTGPLVTEMLGCDDCDRMKLNPGPYDCPLVSRGSSPRGNTESFLSTQF